MTEEASGRIEELLRERARLDAELERHAQLLTVMFSDIVGSTRFYDQHGDLAGLVMVQKFLDTLVPTIEQHEGMVVKTIGDAILARFASVESAVRCAVDMQKALAERNAHRAQTDQIHTRVALNLGLALLKDNDIFGDVVNTCSRIESATDADEIAISPSVYEKIRHLPEFRVRKKAEALAMKGKAKKMDLYAVVWKEGEAVDATPPKPSKEQLAMATGVHTGLAAMARAGGGTPAQKETTPEMPVPPPSAPAAARSTMVFGQAVPEVQPAAGLRFMLVEVQRDGTQGKRTVLDRPGMVAGGAGSDIPLPDDPRLAPAHARFTQLGEAVYVESLEANEGVYLRLRQPQRLRDKDVVLLGRQKFRFQAGEGPGAAAPASEAKATQVMGAPLAALAASGAALVLLDDKNQEGERYALSGSETVLGRSKGTHTFPQDHFMSSTHARVTTAGGEFLLEDLKSTNGTFVRIHKRAMARDGDILLVGGQLLQVTAEAP